MVNSTSRNRVPSAQQQAGVENKSFSLETLLLEELTGTAYVRIHSLIKKPLATDSTIHLPPETGHCSDNDPAVLCLRPLDWLVISQSRDPANLLQDLAADVDPDETAILNVSDSFATFRLSGLAAPWLLNKVSGLDFLAGKTQSAHCTQTKMGHIGAIVYYHPIEGGVTAFDLIVDRSIGKYLWSLLIESANHAQELAKHHGDSV